MCVCVFVVLCADDNEVAIVEAGGVKVVVLGMKAHVGVAGVQEWGAGALWNLAANGAWYRVWWSVYQCACPGLDGAACGYMGHLM